MMNRLSAYTLLLIILFSCESSYDKYKRRLSQEQIKFDSILSDEKKNSLKSFLDGTIRYGETFPGIAEGFYCLWKLRDKGYQPHMSVNDKLLEQGYRITTNSDSLKFLIISGTASHKVGEYSNGGDAIQMETIVHVVDLENNICYKIGNYMGGSPPSTITKRRASDKSGGMGSFFGDDDIMSIIKSEIVSQK